MVGAANMDMRRQWPKLSKISAGSKPPDSGTTLMPRRMTCGMM